MAGSLTVMGFTSVAPYTSTDHIFPVPSTPDAKYDVHVWTPDSGVFINGDSFGPGNAFSPTASHDGFELRANTQYSFEVTVDSSDINDADQGLWLTTTQAAGAVLNWLAVPVL